MMPEKRLQVIVTHLRELLERVVGGGWCMGTNPPTIGGGGRLFKGEAGASFQGGPKGAP